MGRDLESTHTYYKVMLNYNTSVSALPSYYHVEEFVIPKTTSSNLIVTIVDHPFIYNLAK